MKTVALMFSGGLDSVAMAILLKRDGLDLVPIYMSHRANGGNVTKKELATAGGMSRDLSGRPLTIVKKPPIRRGDDAWYTEWGDVHYSRRMPIPKERKGRRNKIFLEVAKQLGFDECDYMALGTLGVSGESEFLAGGRPRPSRQRLNDVTHEKLETGLEPGQLITFESLGIPGKVAMLKAVGRGKRNRELCYASESCLMYFNRPCGDCSSCKSRAAAFMAAWGKDLTRYRKGTSADRLKRGKALR